MECYNQNYFAVSDFSGVLTDVVFWAKLSQLIWVKLNHHPVSRKVGVKSLQP